MPPLTGLEAFLDWNSTKMPLLRSFRAPCLSVFISLHPRLRSQTALLRCEQRRTVCEQTRTGVRAKANSFCSSFSHFDGVSRPCGVVAPFIRQRRASGGNGLSSLQLALPPVATRNGLALTLRIGAPVTFDDCSPLLAHFCSPLKSSRHCLRSGLLLFGLDATKNRLMSPRAADRGSASDPRAKD